MIPDLTNIQLSGNVIRNQKEILNLKDNKIAFMALLEKVKTLDKQQKEAFKEICDKLVVGLRDRYSGRIYITLHGLHNLINGEFSWGERNHIFSERDCELIIALCTHRNTFFNSVDKYPNTLIYLFDLSQIQYCRNDLKIVENKLNAGQYCDKDFLVLSGYHFEKFFIGSINKTEVLDNDTQYHLSSLLIHYACSSNEFLKAIAINIGRNKFTMRVLQERILLLIITDSIFRDNDDALKELAISIGKVDYKNFPGIMNIISEIRLGYFGNNDKVLKEVAKSIRNINFHDYEFHDMDIYQIHLSIAIADGIFGQNNEVLRELAISVRCLNFSQVDAKRTIAIAILNGKFGQNGDVINELTKNINIQLDFTNDKYIQSYFVDAIFINNLNNIFLKKLITKIANTDFATTSPVFIDMAGDILNGTFDDNSNILMGLAISIGKIAFIESSNQIIIAKNILNRNGLKQDTAVLKELAMFFNKKVDVENSDIQKCLAKFIYENGDIAHVIIKELDFKKIKFTDSLAQLYITKAIKNNIIQLDTLKINANEYVNRNLKQLKVIENFKNQLQESIKKSPDYIKHIQYSDDKDNYYEHVYILGNLKIIYTVDIINHIYPDLNNEIILIKMNNNMYLVQQFDTYGAWIETKGTMLYPDKGKKAVKGKNYWDESNMHELLSLVDES